MSTIKGLYNEVKSILQNDAALSEYVGKFYDRERDFISEKYRVVLMLEPVDVIGESTFVLRIIGWVYESNPDRSINDGDVQQILDLENDIKNALRPYNNLTGKCNFFNFGSTRFNTKTDNRNKHDDRLRRPPLYGLEILMNIQFQPDEVGTLKATDVYSNTKERCKKLEIRLAELGHKLIAIGKERDAALVENKELNDDIETVDTLYLAVKAVNKSLRKERDDVRKEASEAWAQLRKVKADYGIA